MPHTKNTRLLDRLPGMAYRCRNNEEWTMLEVSEGSERITGYPKETFLGSNAMSFADLIHPDDRVHSWSEIQRGLELDGTFELEYRIIDKHGTIKNVWDQGEGFYQNGELLELSGFITDHTPKYIRDNYLKRAQQSIVDLSNSQSLINGDLQAFSQELAKRSTETLKTNRASVWLFNDDQTQLELVSLYDSKTDSFSRGNSFSVEDTPKYFQAITTDRAIAADDTLNDPRTNECTDGYLADENVKSLIDASVRISGKVVGVVSNEQCDYTRRWSTEEISYVGELSDQIAQVLITQDQIQQVKILEENTAFKEALKESERLFDLSPDALIQSDHTGQIIKVNQKSCQIFGFTKEELLSMNSADLVPKELVPKGETPLSFVTKVLGDSPKETQMDFWAHNRHGEKILVELSLSNVSVDGKIFPIVSIRDVTERKKMENALRKAKKEAEIASQKKTEFLANMSHEIRTPMNAVLGMAELLRDAELSEEHQGYLDILSNSGNTLLTIINDILDYSKVMEGKITLDNTPFQLSRFINETLSPYQLEHKDTLNISAHIDPSIPDHVISDPTRLHQILNNLLSNACKFTPEGDISLSLNLLEKTHDEAVINISVSDSGIGISPENIDKIFQQFEQADTSTTRLYGGTGLGLAISQRLANLFNGKITVSSDSGVGSVFSFTCHLPLNKSPQALAEKTHLASNFSGMRALLVEDNTVNIKVASALLKRCGVEFDLAENGKEAIEKFQTSSKPYDVIFMDCDMPIMDGFEATKRIRQIERENDFTPTNICALTAHALPELIERCFTSGMDKHLPKPFKPNELENILNFFKARKNKA